MPFVPIGLPRLPLLAHFKVINTTTTPPPTPNPKNGLFLVFLESPLEFGVLIELRVLAQIPKFDRMFNYAKSWTLSLSL